MDNNDTEFWLRGPLPGITPLLQPAAHALLQAQKEINHFMNHFPDKLLWQTPGGIASPAFHLQHITGVLQRLFAYVDSKPLTAEQLLYLSNEGKPHDNSTVSSLLHALNKQIDTSLLFLQNTLPETLAETRYVGRKKIASTQVGLLFHAAEHTMRHTGQLMVTVKIILNEKITKTGIEK